MVSNWPIELREPNLLSYVPLVAGKICVFMFINGIYAKILAEIEFLIRYDDSLWEMMKIFIVCKQK